jgi:MFS transporter, DHA1 family, tetracycline resistance protein
MKNFDRRLIIIFIIQVTEVLGFSLILPFLPFYAQSYGASPFVVGLILTAFSLFQFISSPIMGKLSDTYGRRPLLLISQFSTFISFLVLGFSNTLFLIFLSRIIDGLLGSNFTIAQAYISDITSKEDRSKAFGLSGAAFGFGFLIGPAIGGYLSRFGYHVPAFLAAAIAAITILLTFFYLPETILNKKRGGFSLKEIEIFSLKPFKKYLTNKKTSPHLWQMFFYLLAHATWTTSYSLYGGLKMGLNAETIGFLLAYIGLINIILRIKIIPKLIDVFREVDLTLWGMIFVTVGLFIAPFFDSVLPFMISVTIYSFGTGITRPLLSGAISKSADEKEQGAVMGVTNSLGSFTQIIGPMLGGFLLTNSFPESLLFVSTGIMAVGLIIFLKQYSRSR